MMVNIMFIQDYMTEVNKTNEERTKDRKYAFLRFNIL